MGDLEWKGRGMVVVSAAGRQQAGSCLHQSSGQIAVASQLVSPWLVESCRMGTGAGTASGYRAHPLEMLPASSLQPHSHLPGTVWGSAPGGDRPLWPG